MCLAGAVVASWSLIQEVAGIIVMTNIFVTEFSEHLGKTPLITNNIIIL